MKKAVFFGFLILLTTGIFADTALRDRCRQILYAVNPVDAIGQVDKETFQNLRRVAMGLPVQDQEPLNQTDQQLMFFLWNCETRRRDRSKDEFSLFLQEQHELMEKHIKEGGNLAIKMDGWIDLFRLNLLF
ncbi:MAG: hypothetical protein LBH43_01625 [Treponema sp.]|jgi:hypothetical protein|nr:hypothetical protein [Treponema sp.]